MTTRRPIVAIQAVVVGVLVVVVFLTLLRPEDRGRLFGIRGPGPEKQQMRDGPWSDDRGQPGRVGELGRADIRGRRDEHPPTGQALATPPAVATPSRLEASPPLSTIEDSVAARSATGAPSDDQYLDSITRLISQLDPNG